MLFHALIVCCALLNAVMATPCPGADRPTMVPGSKIDQSVVAVLLHQGAAKPAVIAHIDLTGPFGTETQWTFVAVQEATPSPTDTEDHGPVHVCLVKEGHPDCSEEFYRRSGEEYRPFGTPYHLFASTVVYAGQNESAPLLFIKLCGTQGPNGNCEVATALYQYDKEADRFVRVFLNLTGRNNNEVTRFVEDGPLKGDVLVDYPTEDAPYTYWIEMYRAEKSGRFVQVLRYRACTRYGDGNTLAVIDSEMPTLLARFGFWKPGDELPVPPHTPKGCSHLYMRQGEEWCKR